MASPAQSWRVVGGSDLGGILVRHGFERQSPLHAQRLATAAIVEKVKLLEGRLHYRLLEGSGPEEGWVSIRTGNKDLVVPIASYTGAPRRRLLSQLTMQERCNLQHDLLTEYSKISFQHELHRMWNSALDDETNQVKMRWAACWNVQTPILKRYGFAGSPYDLMQSNGCLRVEDAPAQAAVTSEELKAAVTSEELKVGAWLLWLIHPPAQVAHPGGPPSSATAASMLKIASLGVSSHVPKVDVLAKVPCKRNAPDMVYSIRVVGAMTGELLCTADVSPSDRVCDLKRFICKLEGTPAPQQKLLLDGTLLQCDSDDVASLIQQQHTQTLCGKDDTMGRTNPASRDSAGTWCLTLTLVRLTTERAALLKAFERGDLSLKKASDTFRDDPECVLSAIKRNPSAIEYASDDLMKNRAFMIVAAKTSGGILQYAADWARADREIVSFAVKSNGTMLKHVSAALRADYDIVHAAVEQQGMALQFALGSLHADLDIVLTAVSHTGAALEHADYALKGNRSIVVAALKQDREGAAPHVAPELLQNYAFGATLEDLGLLDDSYFDHLFWATPEVAKAYFDEEKAIFLDARGAEDFDVSHMEGALSMPSSSVHIRPDNAEAFQVVLTSELPIIVYSDQDFPASHCALLQVMLRRSPKVKKYRVLRLIGGLNRWKRKGYPVIGDTREMLRGAPIKLAPARAGHDDFLAGP